MCGISGAIVFDEKDRSILEGVHASIASLNRRGPDCQRTYFSDYVALGHARLSIIDISEAASQPFTDNTGRYTVVFNGEFFNFQQIKNDLLAQGVCFRTNSDTEVLLNLYIREGDKCLNKINGFFAFAIYDNVDKTVFIARDRFGVKPLYYYQNKEKFVFASELKALIPYGIPKELDFIALRYFFQNNYIAPHLSVFKNVEPLLPGTYLKINQQAQVEQIRYYEMPQTWLTPTKDSNLSYHDACRKLKDILDEAVSLRMYSDVPLGAFLSGGIDSSIIVAKASQINRHLHTYSIGYQDEPMFDESGYAELVASKFKTNHTTFLLKNDDLYNELFEMLDCIDEPFADSSALAVYILSKQTKKQVTVALSGDGADEIFGGYNKHLAECKSREHTLMNTLLPCFSTLIKHLPQSRNGYISNKIRQIARYNEGLSLSDKQRYWRWCGYNDDIDLESYFVHHQYKDEYQFNKNYYLQYIDSNDFNSVLYTDMKLVLPGDMLVKVDRMSMANSLEVRNPFMDYNLVDFAFQLPSEFKNDGKTTKKILKDAYKDVLPKEIYHRGKHGFEVPLLKWLRTDLWNMLDKDLLNDEFIVEQGIFELEKIKQIKKQLFSSNPGDIHAKVWALLVFQYWWKKYME